MGKLSHLCLVFFVVISSIPSIYVIFCYQKLPVCIPAAGATESTAPSVVASGVETSGGEGSSGSNPRVVQLLDEGGISNTTTSWDLLSFPWAWNHLPLPSFPPPRFLKIALFVKRWPHSGLAGGMERHASTLHVALARRGHEVHVFTTTYSGANNDNNNRTSNSSFPSYPGANIHFHGTPPTAAGYLNQPVAWEQFQLQNSSTRPFDLVHTESVALFHARAKNISKLAASWHGIAYETIHSDIVQDLVLRNGTKEARQPAMAERLPKVVEEVKFFQRYAHHVATSDHVGDVLRRVYMIPDRRVHVILNGVDETVYKPDREGGQQFLLEVARVPEDAKLVIGMAGRLVKDKGHPVMFEALKKLFEESDYWRDVYVLVAGNGPWGGRYKELGPNIVVLGALDQGQLARFYAALDMFVNPTLRAQGLDHTLLEAMMCGTPVMGTEFASITASVITGHEPEVGYTFHPTVESIKQVLLRILGEGRENLRRKGQAARKRALHLFTATKMTAAYERLFLCISSSSSSPTLAATTVAATTISSDGHDYNYCRYPFLPLGAADRDKVSG